MEKIDELWNKLLEYVPCCTCCNGDYAYLELVNEIGVMIDGRKATFKKGENTKLETIK